MQSGMLRDITNNKEKKKNNMKKSEGKISSTRKREDQEVGEAIFFPHLFYFLYVP